MKRVKQVRANRSVAAWMSLCGALLSTGCGNLGAVLDIIGVSPTTVSLKLVNETGFRVDPEVYVSAADFGINALTEELLTVGVNRLDIPELSAGETVTRSFDCDDIVAVMSSDAELKTGLGFSPSAETDLFLQDEQFECGDTVTVRYTGSVASFGASISAQRFDPLSLLDLVVRR